MHFPFTKQLILIQFLEIYREETVPLIGDIKHDNKGTDSREEDVIKAISKILYMSYRALFPYPEDLYS